MLFTMTLSIYTLLISLKMTRKELSIASITINRYNRTAF
jgi:hypothetical protein